MHTYAYIEKEKEKEIFGVCVRMCWVGGTSGFINIFIFYKFQNMVHELT